MAVLVSPAGTRVEVGDDLAARLIRKGWRVPGKPESKPVPVKRRPGRPRKTA